jgi:hypothetical protein
VKIQIDNRHHYLRSDLFLPLLVFTLIWGLIFISSDLLNAGFNYLVDDHEILVSHNIHTSFQDIFIKPFISLFSSEPKSRFRPLYDVLLRLCTTIYGLNPFFWYLSSLLVAIATSTIFYLVGRLQKFSQLEAIGFAGLIGFGQQAATYTRFGTPETTATLFVALSFLFGSLNSDAPEISIRRRSITQQVYDYLFILFAVLAALNKEACILILPGLAYFKIWHRSKTNNISLSASFKQNRVSTIIILTCSIVFLLYIKIAGVSGPGYAGIDRDTLSIISVLNSVLSNGAIFGSASIANIGYYLTRKERGRVRASSFYLSTALIIIPQLILYNKTGMHWHYILPASIGVSLLTFYPIANIGNRSGKSYKIVMGLVVTILALQLIFTTGYFQTVSKRTAPIQSMISDISNCVGDRASMAIVGNSHVDYEALNAFYRISDLIIHNHQTFLVTYNANKNANLFIDVLKAREQPGHLSNPQQILKNYYQGRTIDRLNPQQLANLKGIVVNHASKVEKSLVALNLDWFQPNLLVKKYYPELDISVYCKK